MLRSMTAYGRGSFSSDIGYLHIELLSVNKKHLDVHVHIPKEFSVFEPKLRKWLGKEVQRGQITLRIGWTSKSGSPIRTYGNEAAAKELIKTWKEIAAACSLQLDDRDAIAILQKDASLIGSKVSDEHEKTFLEALKSALENALVPFMEMKVSEGKNLQKDILKRMDDLDRMVKSISNEKDSFSDEYRKRIEKKLKEFGDDPYHDGRIEREVALLAEKADITEELTRLLSHSSQFRGKAEGKRCDVGKTLDFIMQEILRELNTISSKAQKGTIVTTVIEAKAEAEKIREQLQNVE